MKKKQLDYGQMQDSVSMILCVTFVCRIIDLE